MKNLQNLFVFNILRSVFASTLGFMVVFSLFDTPAWAKSTLHEWEKLSKGSSLVSNNGCFTLRMQTDGNLVLYGKEGRSFWSTETAGKGGKEVVMQGDSNLVMYDSNNRPIWAINPGNVGSGSKLVVQDDGNAVVYMGNRVIWAVNPGKRNCNGTRMISFPTRGSKFTELGNHRRMKTNITISKNGRIDGLTRIWTAHKWKGFTGAVTVAITDADGNILHITQPKRYGVDCKNCPSPSNRTQQWSDTIPSSVLNEIGGYAILHTTNPKTRWRDFLRNSKEAAREIKAIYEEF